jgi:hypothetical protein
MLPASHGERFGTRLLLTFVLPFFGQAVLLTLLANVFALLGAALGRGFAGPLLPDAHGLLSTLGYYVTAHSIFFAGGLFFRGNALVKTLLASLGYAFALGIVFLAFSAAGVAEKVSFDLSFPGNVDGVSTAVTTATSVSRVAWTAVLPLFLYVAAFFRARENEVRG